MTAPLITVAEPAVRLPETWPLVIILLGKKRAGKRLFVEFLRAALRKAGLNPYFYHLQTVALLKKRCAEKGIEESRATLQQAFIDGEKDNVGYFARRHHEIVSWHDEKRMIVVDCARMPADLDEFAFKLPEGRFMFAFIDARDTARHRRSVIAALKGGNKRDEADQSFDEFIRNERECPTEMHIDSLVQRLKGRPDFVKLTNYSKPEVFSLEAARFVKKKLVPYFGKDAPCLAIS